MKINQNKKALAIGELLWALSNLSRIHRLPTDLKQLQQLPLGNDVDAFQRAVRSLGLQVAGRWVAAQDLHRFPMPLLAFVHLTQSTNQKLQLRNSDVEQSQGLVLITRADAERVVYSQAGFPASTVLSVTEFSRRFTGQIFLCLKRGLDCNRSINPCVHEAVSEGGIQIKNLAFRFDEHLSYLYENLNLVIHPGEAIAITGSRGCGKSTLIKLLQGFYPPTGGQITLDGRDVQDFSISERADLFGIVPPETVLFAGTIYDNLTLAKPQATFDQVIQACQRAELHEAIEALPSGYQTVIGARGLALSPVQEQRFSLARALLKQPKVLIVDDATCLASQAATKPFAQTLNTLMGKMTMLFMTHRIPRTLAVQSVINIGKEENNEGHIGTIL